MATVIVTGAGTLSDDIGAGDVSALTPVIITRILLYRTNKEEILSIAKSQYNVAESDGIVTVVFTRQNARGEKSLQFGVSAQPGTALANVNYTAPPSDYTFLSGESVISKDIAILNTHMGPANSKTFRLMTLAPPNKGAYTRGSVSETMVTINGVA